MLVKLKYKIQMFNNKRVQNTNVGSPFWSQTSVTWPPVILSPTPAETAEHCQSTHMGRTTKLQTRSWSFAKCILFEHKAQSREHSTLVPHSDLRLGGSLVLMLLKLSWISSGFVSQPSSHLRPRTACFCVSQSTQPTLQAQVQYRRTVLARMVDSMGMLVNCNGASWAGLSGQAGHWSCLEFGTDAFDA